MSDESSEKTSKQPPLVLIKGVVHFERNFQNLGAFLEFMEGAVERHLKDNLAQWESGGWTQPDDHLFNGFTSFAYHCVCSLLPHRAINLWGTRLAPAVAAAEAHVKKRIHKGSPLHNTAICFFVAGDFDHAYQFMAAADEENRLSGATAAASLLLGNGLSADLLVRPMAAWLRSACGSDYKAVSGHDLDEAELEQMLRWLSIRMPDALQCVVALHRLVKVQTPPHNEASQHIRVRALAELCIVLESATRRWNVACTEELHKQLESVLSANTISLAEFRRLHLAYGTAYPRPTNKSPAAVNWAVKECLTSVDNSMQLSERVGAAMYLAVRLRNSLLHVLEEALDLYVDQARLMRCVGVILGTVRLSQRGAEGTLAAL
jgi:hypothetical protein